MDIFDLLVAGELNVDVILAGLHSAPALGRETLCSSYSTMLGSSSAITACVASSIGLNTTFFAKCGTDIYGDISLSTLKKYGVSTERVSVNSDLQTGVTVSFSFNRDRGMVTFMGDTIDCLRSEEITDSVLKTAKHIHVGSYFLQKQLREGLPDLFKRAKKLGLSTSLDSGWDYTECFNHGINDTLKYTDIFFPNEVEALKITGEVNAEKAAILLSSSCKIAVVKCGADGALMSVGSEILSSPAFQIEVVDTTGAGDSFNAGFIFAYLNGKSLSDCLAYGNAGGSISSTRLGGTQSCPTLIEIQRVLSTKRWI